MNLISTIDKEGFTSDEAFEEMKDNFEVPTVKNPLFYRKSNCY